MKRRFVAFSGGKDSTALAYRLAEMGESFSLLHTPTGNELPEVREHVLSTQKALGVELVEPPGPRLLPLIDTFGALPNHRQRWCTRMIKIQPAIAYLRRFPGSELLIGLRADEEKREGIYTHEATAVYPMREWGWGLAEVQGYLRDKGIKIPKRTDCAWCYGQRLTEWYALWRDNPALFAEAEQIEGRLGHTFRSPSRDTWPASLAQLRAEFESGRVPRGQGKYDDAEAPCRVCRILCAHVMRACQDHAREEQAREVMSNRHPRGQKPRWKNETAETRQERDWWRNRIRLIRKIISHNRGRHDKCTRLAVGERLYGAFMTPDYIIGEIGRE